MRQIEVENGKKKKVINQSNNLPNNNNYNNNNNNNNNNNKISYLQLPKEPNLSSTLLQITDTGQQGG